MGSFLLYSTIPNAELKRSAKQTKVRLRKWFKDNPNRTDCDAQLWYGKRYRITKATIDKAVDKALKAALK